MTEAPHDRPGDAATPTPAGAAAPPTPAGAAVAQATADGAGAPPEVGFGLPVAIALIMGSIIGVYWAPFFLAGGALLLGIPVYIMQRGKMAEPEALPEYR